jgi:tetratricopeptide (TPR) repeat protein
MKTTAVTLIALIAMLLLLTAGMVAQEKSPGRLAAADLIGALNGDTERFERGMKTIESFLALNPKDPEAMVMHGNGVMSRAGDAFQKGDMANAMKLWQSGLAEMGEAVQLAPENIYVRARRGVFLITASRSTPPAMGKPLVELAVSDFEKVLQVREKEQTLAQRSTHQRGELFISLADGWDRMGNAEKARGYFERILKDLKGTTYDQKAKAWLENRPEAKSADFFACSGCHVE